MKKSLPVPQAVIIPFLLLSFKLVSKTRSQYLEVYPNPDDPDVLKGRAPLYFGLIQSLGGPGSLYDGSGSVAGVKVALDRINNDTSILPGHTLHYTFSDSRCEETTTLRAFFTQILNGPTKLALVGAGCSPSTEATASISHFYNISQVSCVSSSSGLKNRVKFPNYFQMLNTEDIIAYAYYTIIKKYGWKQMALIVQDENLFTVTIKRLTGLLSNIDGFDYSEKRFQSDKGVSSLGDNIFDKKYRIFLIATYGQEARALLCEAFHNGIVYPEFLLLTIGWYRENWWTLDDNEQLNCTQSDREVVLERSLAFLNFDFLDVTEDVNFTTDTGITGGEFLEEETQFLNRPPLNLTYSEYSQYCHDGVWTLAYALNATINEVRSNATLNAALSQAYNITGSFQLQDFTYSNNILLNLISDKLAKTYFNGVTGSVSFGPQGIRNLSTLLVLQYRYSQSTNENRLTRVRVGEVNLLLPGESAVFVFTFNESNFTLWNDLIPYDGVPNQSIYTVHISVTIIYCIFATCGLLLSIGCCIFNIRYRNSKLIKLASTKLNYFIIVGAFTLYVNVIFTALPYTNDFSATVHCNISIWFITLGFTLCYGTILVKMARVYYIFNNPTSNKKKLHDWILGCVVMAMVLTDILVLFLFTLLAKTIDEGQLMVKLVPSKENPRDISGPQRIITDNNIYICRTLYEDILIGILFGYKFILQVACLYSAFAIRKVKVRGANDAKYIGAAVYLTSIVLVILLLSNYTLQDYVNVYVVITGTGLLVGTTAILGLVFGPLVVGLYRDPLGDTVFKNTKPTDNGNVATAT